jgi:hypothetical protein
MASEHFERDVDVRPERALQYATARLESAGYQVGARSPSEVHLVHPVRGERLTVRVAGARLRFEFSPSVPGGTLGARPMLERVVDDATRSTADAASPTAVPRRCTVCATRAPDGADFCEVCGGSLA